MPRQGQSVRERNREVRAEDLREKIRNSNLLTDALDNIEEMQTLAMDLDENNSQINAAKIQGLEKSNNQRIKLLDKVMPAQKEIEATVTEKPYEEWLSDIQAEDGED